MAPTIDFAYASDRIIQAGLKTFNKIDIEKEKQLKKLSLELTEAFDSKREKAILLAMSSNYFEKKFVDKNNFEKYFSYLVGEKAFRIDNYVKVRKHMPRLPIRKKSSIPLICFLGKKDPVFEVSQCRIQVERFFFES